MRKESVSGLKLSLLQNAIDYMERAIKSYYQKDYKLGINTLWSSLLLFFKYKLFLIHPALIYTDIIKCLELEGDYFISDKTINELLKSRQFSTDEIEIIRKNMNTIFQDKEELIETISPNKRFKEPKNELLFKALEFNRKGIKLKEPSIKDNFKTVTYSEIKIRLNEFGEKNSRIFLYDHEFKKLQNLRNRIEHYVYDIDENDFLITFHNIMPFVNDFIEFELEEDAEQLFSNWAEFIKIDSLAKSRIETVKKYLKENLPSQKEILNGEVYPLQCDCPECGCTMKKKEDNLFCKFCGFEDNYNICDNCEEVFPESGFDTFDEEMGLCSSCSDDKLGKF